MFGSGTPAPLEQFNAQWGAEWCRQHLDLDNHLYNAHTRILTEHGLTQKQITTLSSHTNLEASNDLLKQAKQHRCGTVVLGRRGKEIEKGFLGGVSDRTVQQAQDIAIWIVG